MLSECLLWVGRRGGLSVQAFVPKHRRWSVVEFGGGRIFQECGDNGGILTSF